MQATQTLSLEALSDSQLLSERQAGVLIGVQPGTLSVWRSTGRYHLPYVKCGRLVRYRTGDLREFLKARTRTHTGG